jgi:hypothetical protein
MERDSPVREDHPVKKLNILKNLSLGILTVLSIGCSVNSVELRTPQPICQLNVDALCDRAIESYVAEQSSVRPAKEEPTETSQLVPLIVPAKMPSGELAAEVDCYASVGTDRSWLV